MNLTYRQVEALLMDLHHIGEKGRLALQARVRHFQRNEWPGGTNTGRGRAASYGFGEMLKLSLGFEMVQVGLTPERAIGVLRDNWDIVRTAIGLAIRNPTPSNADKSFDFYIYCDPTALEQMGSSDPTHDIAAATFFYASAPTLSDIIATHGRQGLRRIALINVSYLLEEIERHLIEERAISAQQFLDAHQAWENAEHRIEGESYKEEFGVYPEDHHLEGEDASPLLPARVSSRSRKGD